MLPRGEGGPKRGRFGCGGRALRAGPCQAPAQGGGLGPGLGGGHLGSVRRPYGPGPACEAAVRQLAPGFAQIAFQPASTGPGRQPGGADTGAASELRALECGRSLATGVDWGSGVASRGQGRRRAPRRHAYLYPAARSSFTRHPSSAGPRSA